MSSKIKEFELTDIEREEIGKLDKSIDKLIASNDDALIKGKTRHDTLRLQEKHESFRTSIDAVAVSNESTGTGVIFVSTLRKDKTELLNRNTADNFVKAITGSTDIKPTLIEDTTKVEKQRNVARNGVGKVVESKQKELKMKLKMVTVSKDFKDLSQEDRMKSVTTLCNVVGRMEDQVEEELFVANKTALKANLINNKQLLTIGVNANGKKNISTMIAKMVDRNEKEVTSYLTGLLEEKKK